MMLAENFEGKYMKCHSIRVAIWMSYIEDITA